jgi:hypothetical protein
VNFGTLPNSTTKMAAYCGYGATACVSVTVILSDGCVISAGYGRDRNHSSEEGLYIDNTLYNIRITAEGNWSSMSAYVLVKYTVT